MQVFLTPVCFGSHESQRKAALTKGESCWWVSKRYSRSAWILLLSPSRLQMDMAITRPHERQVRKATCPWQPCFHLASTSFCPSGVMILEDPSLWDTPVGHHVVWSTHTKQARRWRYLAHSTIGGHKNKHQEKVLGCRHLYPHLHTGLHLHR